MYIYFERGKKVSKKYVCNIKDNKFFRAGAEFRDYNIFSKHMKYDIYGKDSGGKYVMYNLWVVEDKLIRFKNKVGYY